MPELNPRDNEFLNSLREQIIQNLSDEKFGVSELANTIGMSRSNLLRKVQKLTGLSISKYIRNIRLEEAMEMLKHGTSTVSEIAYEVGFGSISYFVKCFREQYGYPPGEAGQQAQKKKEEAAKPAGKPLERKRAVKLIYSIPTVIITLVLLWMVTLGPLKKAESLPEKSIAVLPFKNDSNDSTNVYIINGLMEAILNNLQQIEDLKVVSRTSVEKYRQSKLTIPEIARELNVSYVIEGSGQKIGDQILLNVQLIKGEEDDHLWAEQYNRQVKDIFTIQQEVAKNIANEIEAIVKPEEEERINEIPTHNLVAYDYYLKGMDSFNRESMEGLEAGINWMQKAIEEDEEFANAHAALGMAYYFLDMFTAGADYIKEMGYHADKALLYNPQLASALTAKALYFVRIKSIKEAETYLLKALEYNPNSAMVLNQLSDIYATHFSNPKKYLEYALRGVDIDIASNDSTAASFIYLHLSNAFIQSGFVEESIRAINKSLAYKPDNLFSEYVKAYVLFARDRDLDATKETLIATLARDTNRFDIMQEIGNTCYYLRDYDCAYKYFSKFVTIRERLQLDAYPNKNAEISLVYGKMGYKEDAAKFMKAYKAYVDASSNSIYYNLNMAMYYAHMGEEEKALEHLRLFSEEDEFQYWIILFTPMDPMLDNIKDNPEFTEIFAKLEQNFWANHRQIRSTLEMKNLLNDL
jgi:TolB-like protein/AraC-like DNA-binding protein